MALTKNQAIANLYGFYMEAKADPKLGNQLRYEYDRTALPRTILLTNIVCWLAFPHQGAKQRVSELHTLFCQFEGAATSVASAFDQLQERGLRGLIYPKKASKPSSGSAEQTAEMLDAMSLSALQKALESLDVSHLRPTEDTPVPLACDVNDVLIQIIKRLGKDTISTCWVTLPENGNPSFVEPVIEASDIQSQITTTA